MVLCHEQMRKMKKKHGLNGVLLLIIWWDENIWNVCDDIMDGYEMAAVSVRSAN